MNRRYCLITLLATFVLTAACSKSNPSSPSSAANGAAVTSLTASIVAPRPLSPDNNTSIAYVNQPVTLIVKNAISTKPGGTVYTFEVATDAGFSTKVQTKDGVAEGVNGQTSVTLDTRTPGDYYWHARATGGGTTGVFGATYKFTIGPLISIDAPVPIAPPDGAVTGARPILRVRNAVPHGPAGPITYKFEVATSSTFSSGSIVLTMPNTEGVNETGIIPTADFPINVTLYWHAIAMDAGHNLSSPPSPTRSLLVSPALAIDLSNVIQVYKNGAPSGPDVASWPVTGTIDSVEQDGNPAALGVMCISFHISESGSWPSIPFEGDPNVPIYANQWYFANIGGQWYGGPGEYLRSDRGSSCKTGQGTNSIGPDGGWNSPMNSWAPRVGELVGFMMSTPARNWPGYHTTNQRSNVVLQAWRDTSLGSTLLPSVRRR